MAIIMVNPKIFNAYNYCILTIICSLLISATNPFDRLTWILEICPVIIILFILIISYKIFPLTYISYLLITISSIILCYGAHYTYAEAPFGKLINSYIYDFHRNNFDRVGHFMQGFVPAIIIRELIIRTFYSKKSFWIPAIIIFSCLGMSAMYELIEFATALILGQGADEFLATQGDEWDTQWDMLFALIGAISALILLSKKHDDALLQLSLQ